MVHAFQVVLEVLANQLVPPTSSLTQSHMPTQSQVPVSKSVLSKLMVEVSVTTLLSNVSTSVLLIIMLQMLLEDVSFVLTAATTVLDPLCVSLASLATFSQTTSV